MYPIYIISLHTYYVLYKAMHSYTGLYIPVPIHSYTEPYKAIQTYLRFVVGMLGMGNSV